MKWFGIVWMPETPVACIVTRVGFEPTATNHRCWSCYGILMLHQGQADTDPAVYTLTCGSCGIQYLANFPDGEVPGWVTEALVIPP